MRVLGWLIVAIGAGWNAENAAAQTIFSSGNQSARLTGFGSSMLVLGDEIAVGRGGGGAWTPRGGGVHLFRRGSDGNWAESTMLQASDSKAGDGFGQAMSADADWMAVGAPAAGVGGAVYLFRRTGGTWNQAGRIALPDAASGDGFGASVLLRGTDLVIGVPGKDSSRGAAFALRNSGSGWSAPQLVVAGEPNDRLGGSLEIGGGRLFVSASGPAGFGGRGPRTVKPGAVVVFRRDGTAWAEDGRITAPAEDSVTAFGVKVLAAGGEILIAAPAAHQGAGVVYRFQRAAAGGWTTTGQFRAQVPNEAPQPGAPPPTFMMFGAAMVSAGGQLIVGAPLENRFAGAIHVVGRNGSDWAERQRLVPEEGGRLSFGGSIAASERLLVVGAPGADFGEGLAFVYARDNAGQWSPAGKLVDKPYSLPAITGGTEKKCEGGKTETFDCQEVDLLAYLPIDAVGGGRGVHLNDIWGWTDPTTDREYALVGRVDGTAFVDVTDPVNPKYLGSLPLTDGARPAAWRDIKVYKDHAFIVADGAGQHGMQVFDLTRLRNVTRSPADFLADTTYDKIASAHNIVINQETGFAYSVGGSAGGETCGGGLHMIDIRDPKHPAFAGCFADKSTGRQKTGYTHDAMCVNYHGPDARYSGRELCFNASETAVGIADVTDKDAPKAIAVAEYPNTAYAHQGWISEDQKYFFLNDELDELSGGAEKTRTMVWDVTKLDEPVLIKQFLGSTAATDHNMYVRGRYLYQSNYVAGLRILDIADPANPIEVGYFDTVPWGENTPGFDGSWSNYPFFKSGTIVVSSIGQGLFIVKHRQMSPVP